MRYNDIRNINRLRSFIFLAVCMVLALLGCGEPSSSPESPGGVTPTSTSPTVTSVTVSPANVSVAKGGTQKFTAVVTGTGSPAQTVTWTVESGGAGTTITNGLLTVDANETAETFTVRATSTVNTSKSGTATVHISALTGAVIINGTAREGYSLTTNADNIFGSGTISYQWRRANTAEEEGVDIPGATTRTYNLVADDVGQYITVMITRAGNIGSITSSAIGPVEPASLDTGSVNGTVTVNNGIENVTVSFTNIGDLILQTDDTLTVIVSGSYQAYRWYVDGVALSEVGGSLVINGADYTTGTHRILVIVYRNGVPYSQEIRFKIPVVISVTGVIVSPANVNVVRGGTQQFAVVVNGTGDPAQTVTWTVEGGGAGTTITNGLLTVAANETAATLTVRATSTEDITQSGTATVTLTGTTVTGVTVSPANVSVIKGGTQMFTATVNGIGSPAQTVTWTVAGGGAGTTITNGLLTVAANETAVTLTVRATSTEDISKSGTATITVTEVSLPTLTGVVIINGTAQNGYSLTANTNNLFGNGTISYQWKRANTAQAEGTNISGATDRTYALVNADVGQYITVTVTRANNSGSITSSAIGPVEPASVETGSVNGTVTVNNGIENVTVNFTNIGNLTLSTSGTLTVTVSGSYQAYRWYVDGVALSDEVGGSLVINGADYTTGTHRILVIVYRNSVPYSQEIRFTIN